jgi:methionine biosynthesis protein MetW
VDEIRKLDYDDYWKDKIDSDFYQVNAYQKIRAKFISQNISNGDHVLDVGCGNGAVLRHMKTLKEFKPQGIDISEYALSKLKEEGFDVYKRDITSDSVYENIEGADHILFLEVLEHMPNSEEYLLNALSKAKKSVFFSFPNTGYISFRLRLLFGKFPLQWITHPGEHLRYWTWTDLKWWLKSLKLIEKSKVFGYGGVPVLNRLWPSLFSRAIIVQVKK